MKTFSFITTFLLSSITIAAGLNSQGLMSLSAKEIISKKLHLDMPECKNKKKRNL